MRRVETSSIRRDESFPVASLIPPADEFDSVIVGLSQVPAWSLWVPTALPISPASVAWLARPDALLTLWHANTGGSRSRAAREKGRAFGVGSPVVSKLAAAVTIQVDDEAVYSDIAIATRDATSIARFLSRPMAPLDSAAAVFWPMPADDLVAAWIRATLPLLSLWLDRAREPIGFGDLDSFIIAFLRQSLEYRAIPVLQLRDASGGACILALGERSALTELAQGLRPTDRIGPELAVQLSRGLGSPLAP